MDKFKDKFNEPRGLVIVESKCQFVDNLPMDFFDFKLDIWLSTS